MPKYALVKDIIRDIKNSLGRFLSIAAIIALGVAFFTGLKIAPQDMKGTANKYYNDYKLMDIRIVSTLGLTEDDVKEIRKIEGVEEVFETYTMDVLGEYKENEVVLKVHGLPSSNGINNINLTEGRLPENLGECVIERGKNDSFIVPIGSTIKLNSGTDDPLEEDLKHTEYKVVGTVQTPYYLSFEKGNSNIGNGQVKSFIMIDQEDFKLPVYTDIYLTVKGAREVNSYGDEYFPIIDQVSDRLKDLAKDREIIRYDEIIGEALEELEEGKDEYYKEKKEAEEKLDEALKDIEDGKKEILKGERELEKEEKDFHSTIKEGKEKLAQGERDLIKGEEEYEKGLEEFKKNKALAEEGFQLAEGELKRAEEAIIELESAISQIRMGLQNPQLSEEEKVKLNTELETLTISLEKTRESLERGKKELEEKKLQLLMGERELAASKEMLASSRKTLDEERNKLLEGEKKGLEEIRKAKADLEEAREDLAEGEREYLEAKEEAEKELAKAWTEIEKGEKEIEDIEEGKWYVLDRNSHYSFVDYKGAADRIDALAKVFPLFFALVAALVSLTTMARMVDEQRVNIGTLKALGYKNIVIASKYVFYAFAATLLGSIIGVAIGFTIFPIVIFNAYGIMYVLPPVNLEFNTSLALFTSIAAIGLTTMTAYLACSNELKETSLALLRPRAPKAGKRILLERIPFIWNRFNFSGKVTIRNIFRYKRKFLMTVFGIAGCTALILAAFGIRDSIRAVVDIQFGEIYSYDITIGLDKDGIDHLEDDRILGYQLVHKEGGKLVSGSTSKDINIVVPRNTDSIDQYIKLRNRKDKTPIDIPEEGIIVSEQVSRSLGIKSGDEIILRNSDDRESMVKVDDITENYLMNYVYLSPEYYEELFAKETKDNEALGIIRERNPEFEDKLSRDLITREGINNINFNTTIKNDFENTIRSLNYVVFILIISAGALAFVVLYNLTNVNISERIREIATIKVLGFYDREVSAYIYRENTLLTVVGTLAGLVIGIFLHRYIMTTVEMDNLMFGLKLNPKSYLISVVLTFGFAVLVNFAMYYKLKNVEMVESLKSID